MDKSRINAKRKKMTVFFATLIFLFCIIIVITAKNLTTFEKLSMAIIPPIIFVFLAYYIICIDKITLILMNKYPKIYDGLGKPKTWKYYNRIILNPTLIKFISYPKSFPLEIQNKFKFFRRLMKLLILIMLLLPIALIIFALIMFSR
jgi:SNF family Na+-dependent transporter